MRRAVAAVVAGMALLAWASPAHAADTGTLAILPGQGTLDTPIDVVTSGVCTQGVTFVVAVRGAGIDPATSGNAVGSTALSVLEPAIYPGHHAVPLSRTLREFFVGNGVGAPKGSYDLVFACRNRLDLQDLQTFTGSMRIKGDSYAASGAAALPLEEFLAATGLAADAEATEPADPATAPSAESSGQSGEAATNQGDAPGSGDAVSADAATASPDASTLSTEPGAPAEAATAPSEVSLAEAASTTSTADASGGSGRTLLLITGAVLLLGAAFLYWRSRRSDDRHRHGAGAES